MEKKLIKTAWEATKFQSFIGEIEYHGIGVDLFNATQSGSRLSRDIEGLRQELFLIVGNKDFNFNSPAQIGKYLSTQLGRIIKSTAADRLNELQKTDPDVAPFIEKLKTYRGMIALSNNINGILKHIDNERIYPEYNTTDSKTGRVSSHNPNIQVFVREGGKYNVRKLFIPREEYKFVSFDFNQLEFRVLAGIIEDDELIQKFVNGMDFHEDTGKLLGVDRKIGKVINFLTIFGGGVSGFQKAIYQGECSITFEDAERFMKEFKDKKYPKIKDYYDETSEQLKNGYVEGYFRRRRHFKSFGTETFGEGINARIQGTAVDLVMRYCNLLYPYIMTSGIYPVLFHHDSVMFEVKIGNEFEFVNFLKLKVKEVKFPCPLDITVSMGDNWYDMKEIKVEEQSNNKNR